MYNFNDEILISCKEGYGMHSVKLFFQLDIVKEIVWTLVIFISSMVWSLALMLCVDFMLFAYNSITFFQFSMAALVIALAITGRHIYITAKKYKKGDKSVL